MNNSTILASFKAHICPRCDISYLLFKKGALCPNCKYEEVSMPTPHAGFVGALLEVMTHHKRKYNRYTPSSWFMGDVPNDVSKVCFEVFDRIEMEKGSDPESTIKKSLDDMDWRKKAHLKIHAREIIAELYKKYLKRKPRHTLFSKLKTIVLA